MNEVTLKDYFAAKIMQALISNNDDLAWDIDDFIDGPESLAKRAYILANALIEQREKQ